MGELTKSTVVQAVFENLYDRLSSNLSPITLTDGTTSTIQTFTGAFPDKDIDNTDKYPICVINSPNISWEELTFTKKQVMGTFTVDIYTFKSESADKFLDALIYSLETYRNTLRTYGMTNINLESTDSEHVTRGKNKIHMRSATFKFSYVFNKTITW